MGVSLNRADPQHPFDAKGSPPGVRSCGNPDTKWLGSFGFRLNGPPIGDLG
jgi:hypothetical protein